MRTSEQPRIINTEHLYKFRKNHQKKRIQKAVSKGMPIPVMSAKILCKDGMAPLGEITGSDGKYLTINGKGTKSDSERGRCVVFKINPDDIHNEKSNLLLERTR